MWEKAEALAFVLVVTASACSTPTPAPAPAPIPASTPATSPAPTPWAGGSGTSPTLEPKIGLVVTLEGIAQNHKIGAALMSEGLPIIYIDALSSWPGDVRGKRVQVTGKVTRRSDLPVFVQNDGEPQMQGMPVPKGTDLEMAGRRFLLSDAKWKVME